MCSLELLIIFHIAHSTLSPDLMNVLTRNVEDLSGGELQRFAIAVVCIQNADM